MSSNKETSIGIKLVADLRNYQANMAKAQSQTKTFSKNVKSGLGDVKNSFAALMRGDVTALPGFFKSATTAAGGFAKGLQGVKVALISTGIGALLVGIGLAIASVTRYFKGTEEGQIVFKKVMNNIKAYTEPVLQMFGRFGKALVELFSGKFAAAWETAKGAIAGVGDQIDANKAKVGELNALEENYIKNKRKYLIENKALEAEIAEARLKAENEEMYTAEQRVKYASEAIAKQKQLAKNKIDLLNQETQIEQIKGDFGDNDIATNDRLADLKAQQFEIMREQDQSLRRMSETQQRISKEVVAELAARERMQKAAGQVSFNTIETRENVSVSTKGKPANLDLKPKLNLEEVKNQMPVFQGLIDDMNAKQDELQEKAWAVQGAFEQGFAAIGESVVAGLGLASSGFEGFIGQMISTVTQLLSMYLAQSIAASVAGATQSAAATGPAAIITQPAFLATMIGGVLAAFAAIPKFEQGGIVPGASLTGDRMLIRANSGEEILRRDDPRHRFNQSGTAPNSGGRDRLIIPSLKIRKGDIHIAFREGEKQAIKRNGR